MRKPELPSISPKTRRTLIFLVTVAAGTLLILYDLPAEYLLGGTIAAGCIVLIAFGAIKLSDLRPKNIREGLKAWVAERKQRPLKKEAPKEKIGSRTAAASEEKRRESACRTGLPFRRRPRGCRAVKGLVVPQRRDFQEDRYDP